MEERLIALRREKGLSQEALADALGVSRQAVGKWESGGATPELTKLVALAELYQVSLDELVLGYARTRSGRDDSAVLEKLQHIERSMERLDFYEYKSERTFMGIPLVHVKFSRHPGRFAVAKGVIAVGNVAVGALACGGIACGIVGFGGLSLGALLALGGFSVGGFALGGMAAGIYALGGMAAGLRIAIGGGAVARELAIGGMADARVALGEMARGQFTLNPALETREAVEQFLRLHCSGLPHALARFISFMAGG